MFEPRGNGFKIEGPVTFDHLKGITIDRLDLTELLRQQLAAGEMAKSLERVRLTVEVIED
jgi:hypothetical protein